MDKIEKQDGAVLLAHAQGDRLAIKMLVDAGYITEAKANEALNIAHGFDKGPLAPPSAPVGVEELSPIYGQVPTVDEARAAIGTALDDAAKALRVLSTMLKKQKLMQGYAVADEILGSIGYAQKLNSALAQQPAAVDEAFVARLADALIANGWDVDPDCDGSGIVELRDAVLAAQPGGGR